MVRVWLGYLLVFGGLVLAVVFGLLSPSPVYGETLHYGDFTPYNIEKEDGRVVLEYHVLLSSPDRASFTLYLSNGNEVDAVARVYLGSEEVLSAVVPARSRGMVGTIVLEGQGYRVAQVSVSVPGESILAVATSVKLAVAASGPSGEWWAWFLAFSAPIVVGVYSLMFRFTGRWARGWLPGVAGVLAAAVFLYHHGPPRPFASSVEGAPFYAYTTFALWARGVEEEIAVLAVIVGALAAYYPRGGGWEAGEALTGRWGPALVARRLVIGSLGIAVSFLAATLGLAFSGGLLQAFESLGLAGPYLGYLLRDAACVLVLALSISVLAAGVSFALRAPILVMVVGVMLIVTLASVGCSLGLGGYTFGPSEYRYDLDRLARLSLSYLKLGLLGVAAFLAGWVRR